MAEKDGEKKGDNGDLDLSKNPVIIEMGKTIKGLGILLTQQQAATAKTNESLNSLVEVIKEGKLSGSPKPDDKKIDPDAINDLDNSQLVPLVLSEVGKLLDSKIGKIGERIDKTDQDIVNSDVKKQVEALIRTSPDFFEWSSEIKELAAKNSGLNVKQLYTLARSESQSKAEEMDEKYKKEGEKGDEEKPGLIGLMPTSGVTAEGDEKLTKGEAAAQAWEDTLENFPEIAQLGEG